MAKILLLNGPNLNLLGTREPHIYGSETLKDLENLCRIQALELGHELESFQSNAEGELIDAIQQAPLKNVAFAIVNLGGYTHTSVALRDALLAVGLPFIEVHISNVFAREGFRQDSLLSDVAVGVISGLGIQGYELAIRAASQYLNQP